VRSPGGRFRRLLLASALLACTGCGEPAAPAEVSGVIVQQHAATAGSDAMLFVTQGGDSAYVHVPAGAGLFRRWPDGVLRPVRFGALRPGVAVDVWTTSVEYLSDPPQLTARLVVMR